MSTIRVFWAMTVDRPASLDELDEALEGGPRLGRRARERVIERVPACTSARGSR